MITGNGLFFKDRKGAESPVREGIGKKGQRPTKNSISIARKAEYNERVNICPVTFEGGSS